MNIKQAIKSKFLFPVRDFLLATNYWLDNYKEVIWLIGDARSGTTWVSDLINHDKKYREMFEPFNPQNVDEMKFMLPHLYMRPDDSNERLEKIADSVFSGKFIHPWCDSVNRSLFYKGLLL